MIHDALKNLERYKDVIPALNAVSEFLKNNPVENLSAGTTEIDGRDIYVNHDFSLYKKKEDARLEGHRRYIDVQVPVLKDGETEVYGWHQNEGLSDEVQYDEARDIEFFREEATSYITLRKGEFVVFFPGEGHAPLIGDGKEIEKLIFKVRL